jgi:hypothetical protein
MIDLVISANQRLHASILKLPTFGIDGTPINYDEMDGLLSNEVEGLGLCIISLGDVRKGIAAYSALLRRYALHVRMRTYMIAQLCCC